MARTKKTARVSTNKDPHIGSQATTSTPSRGGKSMPAMKSMRKKRVQNYSACLKELRKVMKHMTLSIPKLSFQRVVRGLCEQRGVTLRWQSTALACLHEAAEDFIKEFFVDSYILAAHAHRITVMPKDMHSLRLLRFRYDKSLQPAPISDPRMADILYMPPISRPVKVTEVPSQSIRMTRQTVNNQVPEVAPENREDVAASNLDARRKLDRYRGMRDCNIESLICFDDFDVHIPVRDALLFFPFFQHDIEILRDPRRELTAQILMPLLRFVINTSSRQCLIYILISC